MRSCGVIVEYNPFHNGHKYHLEEAKKTSNAEVVVAVMSGNFLQRGEPAIINKWARAEAAIKNGADLVIELPFAYAVQSADYFTRGGIKLLHALDVDGVCFGTDNDEHLDYAKFGEFHQENISLIDKKYQEIKNNGDSYPQLMTQIYREIYPEWTLDFSSPNHILGMGYAKENAKYEKPMAVYPIKRLGNHHHDQEIHHTEFASGTSIRQKAFQTFDEDLRKVLPKETYDELRANQLIDWESAWPFLEYQLVNSKVEGLRKIYQMVEGLEYRLKEAALKANNFNEFVELVKSKRYTWTRIQRLCTYVLLQITQEEIEKVWENSYIRVLGFNNQGRQYLKEKKKSINLPIITNINRKNENLVSLDIQAGQIYGLLNRHLTTQDYYRGPIYIKEEVE